MHASSVLHWGWSHQRTQGLGAAIHDFFRLGCGRGLSAVLALLAVEGLMHLAPACSFWLLLGVAFYEWPKMAQANALSLIYAKPLLYLAAAAMGFGVNILAYIVIQLASSLTLKVSSAVFLPPWVGIPQEPFKSQLATASCWLDLVAWPTL